jgi:hypothetical protein
MGADKIFSRRRLKFQQDELARSDPQNHVATGVLLVLGTNTTSSLNSYTNTAAETTWEPDDKRGRLDRVWGRLDQLHQETLKSSETPLPRTKTHHGFTNRDLWSRPR